MRKLFFPLVFILSIQVSYTQSRLSTFSKTEVKEGLVFLSLTKSATSAIRFVFATNNAKGLIKIDSDIVSLNLDGGDDTDSTSKSYYSNAKYSVLSSKRILEMGKDRNDPATVWERSIEIKDISTGKALFKGKVYLEPSPKEPGKYSILDVEVIDQVLNALPGGLKTIPQTEDKSKNSSQSPLKILKGSSSTSSIITDKASYVIFTSYDFQVTPANSAKILKEFLEFKKEMTPFSEKEKVKTEGKETSTSFTYWRPSMFALMELKIEKMLATEHHVGLSIEYRLKDKANGASSLLPVVLDSVLANAGTISRVMKQKEEVAGEDHFYTIHARYNAVNPSLVMKPSPWVRVNKSKYTYTVQLGENSSYTVPKFFYEIKKYMAEKYKSTGLLKAGKSFELPNELIFSKFDKNNPALEMRVAHFEKDDEVLFRFTISNTISSKEATNIAALPDASQATVPEKKPESKPPLLKMFRDKNGLYGFQDLNNGLAVVIPAEYKSVGKVSEGLIAVTKDGNKWGYINEAGKLVIPYRYLSAKEFLNGKALVEEGDLIESTKFQIDKTGKRLN